MHQNFTAGVWFAFLDTLFQDEFKENETAGRVFWTTILLIHYLFVEKGGIEAREQFLNIHAHDTRLLILKVSMWWLVENLGLAFDNP